MEGKTGHTRDELQWVAHILCTLAEVRLELPWSTY